MIFLNGSTQSSMQWSLFILILIKRYQWIIILILTSSVCDISNRVFFFFFFFFLQKTSMILINQLKIIYVRDKI